MKTAERNLVSKIAEFEHAGDILAWVRFLPG